MANGKLDRKEIYADDIFKEIGESAKKAKEIIVSFEGDISKLSESIKKVGLSSAADIKKLAQSEIELQKISQATLRTRQLEQKLAAEKSKATQQQLKSEKELANARGAAIKAQGQQIANDIKLAKEKERLAKIAEREAKATLDETNAYKKLTKSTNEAQAEFKRLAAQFGVTDKRALAAQKEFIALDNRLRKVNEAARDGRRDVGRYHLALGNIRATIGKGLGLVGITAGVAGLRSAVSGAIGIFTSFEKSLSNLKAVSQATEEEITALSESALKLGATTAFTATQVVELQTEFAKLGFPTEDILKLTDSTLNAAAAMGSGLAETAALTGATLKAFGLDASEAQRVNDVLTKSTQASALDFSKLNTAISQVAPVAKSFGFSVEETTALLGQLSNAGFDASTAATSTRNILLNLADANGALAQSLGKPVTDLPSLVEGLKTLKEQGTDLGEALELTDKRSVAAFNTFLEGTDSVLALNDALNDSAGTAARAAETQLDNLAGAVTILQSAYEGFILSLENGNGAFAEFLKQAVRVVTEILSIASGTAKLKSELTEAESEVRRIAEIFIVVAKVVGTSIAGFVTYRVVLTLYSKAVKIAAISTKGFNTAIKANPLGLILTAITSLVAILPIFASNTDKAAASQNRFNDTLKKGRDLLSEVDELLREGGSLAGFDVEQLKSFVADADAELTKLSDIRRKQISQRKEITQAVRDNNKELVEEFKRLKAIQDADPLSAAARATLAEFKRTQNELTQKLQDEERRRFGITSEEATKREILLNKELEKAKRLIGEKGDTTKATSERELGIIEKLDKEIQALNKKRQETRNKAEIARLNKEIEAAEEQKRKLLEIEDKFLKKIEKKKTDSIELILKKEKDSSDELAKLLNDIFAELDRKEKTAFDQRIDRYTTFVNQVANLLNTIDQAEAQRIQNQISRNDKALSEQQSRAEQGLTNELNFRRKKDAELAQLEEKRQKREQRRAKILAYFELLAQNAKSNPDTAAVKSAAQVALAEAISGFFFDGTESVGDNTNVKWRNTGKDDYLAAVHKGERIIPTEGNMRIEKALGKISNDDLVKMLENHHQKQYIPIGGGMDDSRIVKGLEKVGQSVGNIKVHVDIDSKGMITQTEFREGLKRVIKQRR